MPHLLDHSVWAVRPEALATIQRLTRVDLPVSDLQRLLTDPQAPEGRVSGMASVDPDDLTRVGSVAILSLTGIIQPNSSLLSYLLYGGGGSLQQFRAELRAALEDDTIDAILLHVDSPGGRTSLVEETAAEVRAARDIKPIVAVANTMACSAAYYIASQATTLVVTPSGYVGSIGVYILHTDLSGALEQEGVTMTYVYAGRFKVDGNAYEPLSDSAREDWQHDVDGIYASFVRDVALGRQTTEAKVLSDFGEGRVLRAADALAAGMVDRVATFEDALEQLRQTVDPPTNGGGGRSALLPGQRAEAPAPTPQADPPAPEPQADPPAPEPQAEDPAPTPEPEPTPSQGTAADDFDTDVIDDLLVP